jgi:ABC-type multidrug transport system fused ATPase/permease subunit
LSGGQQQRVALARAMLKNGSIYLLDEPTTALDGVVAQNLQKTLDELCTDATTICITHHLTDLKTADQVSGRACTCDFDVHRSQRDRCMDLGGLHRRVLTYLPIIFQLSHILDSQIIYLKEGKIVEQGNYDTLLAKGGAFSAQVDARQ